jgi:serine protease Do
MTPHPTPKRNTRSLRRALLVATSLVAIGSATMVAPPAIDVAPFAGAAHAQNLSAEAKTVDRPAGFADVVETVKPAVISVRVKKELALRSNTRDDGNSSRLENFLRRFGLPDDVLPDLPRAIPGVPKGRGFASGQGSGFFISADGYAVTNHHVVDDATSVEVGTDDGKTYTARVVGRDQRTDLALIKVEGRTDFPFVKFADRTPRIGDWVLAIGNPFGLSSTVTAGIVSARGRDIGSGPYDFIQIDAPVNRGNSGGPTFDVNGNVIGVNAAIFSPSGGNVGIAFAIPAETVKTVVAQLREKGSVTRGWLGVQIQSVTPDIADGLGVKAAQGALVAQPQADSPASKAGLAAGDVITSVDGEPVKDARDLARTIANRSPGSTVQLGIRGKSGEKTVSVTLAEMPAQRQAAADTGGKDAEGTKDARLGVTVAPAGSVGGAGDEGVVVTAVDPDGPAADKGLRTGDVILQAAGKPVSNAQDVRQAVAAAQNDGKKTVLLRIKSENAVKFVAVPIARG